MEPKVKNGEEEPEIEKLEMRKRELLRIAKTMLHNLRRARFARHGAAEIWFTITVATMIVAAVVRAKTLERAIAASKATRSAIWRTDWAIDEDPGAHRMPLPA